MTRHTALSAISALATLASLTAGASAATPRFTTAPAVVENAVDAFVAQHTKSGIHIRIGPKDRLAIHCPVGVLCDGKFDYRAVKTTTSAGSVSAFTYLSFSSNLTGKLSAKRLNEAFSYMYSIVNLTALTKLGWDVRLDSSEVYRKGNPKFTIIGYKHGRLQAQLKTTVTRLSGHKDGCAVGHRMPMKCMVRRDVSIPMTITLDVPIEAGVLDCRGGLNKDRCG